MGKKIEGLQKVWEAKSKGQREWIERRVREIQEKCGPGVTGNGEGMVGKCGRQMRGVGE